ncbi:hypothetical protein Ahy_A09g042902 [Arachis hypogaea]|uniref:Uncharacterized protein n=1 Tax=Arachis hypogaea TaxID=3818 RepID=A0A445BH14_ARAHY|nr:hypothetical protein Ahy_A09g042902 [Arachis hypogaea]
MNSKSKKPASTSIRVFGQRSIDSTFHSLPSNPFNDSERNARNELGSRKSQNAHVSLSNFLDRKLPKSSSILSQTVQVIFYHHRFLFLFFFFPSSFNFMDSSLVASFLFSFI